MMEAEGMRMVEREIEIRTADGVAGGFVYRPEGAGTWPGVLHLTDIGGIRPAYHEMARRVAGAGFVVLMPNVFYRTAKPPVMTRGSGGEEEFRKRFAELTDPLTPESIARDAKAYVDCLAGLEQVGPPGRFGVVGYCYTGGFALRVAAACPDRIAVAASFHGGGLATEAATSPHLLLPQIRARLYFGHAVKDRSMPEEAIHRLETALADWGGEWESEVYEGAYHSWTASDSPLYNGAQAERAFEKLVALLHTLR